MVLFQVYFPEPSVFLQHSSLLQCYSKLLKVLLLQANTAVSIVEGLPGIGKSTLLARILRSQQVSTRYCDGVVAVHVGPNSSLPAVLLRVLDGVEYLALGQQRAGAWDLQAQAREVCLPTYNTSSIVSRVAALCMGRSYLIVLEDVMDPRIVQEL